jgi:hypothetical protein
MDASGGLLVAIYCPGIFSRPAGWMADQVSLIEIVALRVRLRSGDARDNTMSNPPADVAPSGSQS